jgi:hypothetical protein
VRLGYLRIELKLFGGLLPVPVGDAATRRNRGGTAFQSVTIPGIAGHDPGIRGQVPGIDPVIDGW